MEILIGIYLSTVLVLVVALTVKTFWLESDANRLVKEFKEYKRDQQVDFIKLKDEFTRFKNKKYLVRE